MKFYFRSSAALYKSKIVQNFKLCEFKMMTGTVWMWSHINQQSAVSYSAYSNSAFDIDLTAEINSSSVHNSGQIRSSSSYSKDNNSYYNYAFPLKSLDR